MWAVNQWRDSRLMRAASALKNAAGNSARTGMRADFVHWRIAQPAELCYWLGGDLAGAVYSGGRQVA